MANLPPPAVNKAVTPLGPLETFTPPSSCFTEFEWSVTQDLPQTAIADWGGRNAPGNSCYPSRSALATGQFFSPGLCPDGWIAVSTAVGSVATESSPSTSQTATPTAVPVPNAPRPFSTSFTSSSITTALVVPNPPPASSPPSVTVSPTPVVFISAAPNAVRARAVAHVVHERRDDPETTLLCCPSGFRPSKDPNLSGDSCYSTLFDGTPPQRNVTLYLVGDPPRLNVFLSPTPSTVILTAASSTIASYTGLARPAIVGVGGTGVPGSPLVLSVVRASILEVRYQHLPTPTKKPEPGANESNPGDNTDGLSNGAKIGMGVGIPAMILFIAAAVFILWRRRKRTKQVEGAGEGGYVPYPGVPEMHDTQRFEKDGKDVAFVPPMAYELAGEREPSVVGAHELPVFVSATPQVQMQMVPPTTTVVEGPPPARSKTMAAPWEAESDPMHVPVYVHSHVPSMNAEPSAPNPRRESPIPEASASGSEPMSQEKLDLLQKELQRVKQQRERLQQLQQLESRETELERMIQRELERR